MSTWCRWPANTRRTEFVDSGLVGVDEVRFNATVASTLTLYAGDTGIEQVSLASGTAGLAINAAQVQNALILLGNAGANRLTGQRLQWTRWTAAAASTPWWGGAGNDSYRIDTVGDLVSETSASGGLDRVLSSISYTPGRQRRKPRSAGGARRSAARAMPWPTACSATMAPTCSTAWRGNDSLNGRRRQRQAGGRRRQRHPERRPWAMMCFRFETATGSGNLDRIVDFKAGADKIELENAIFTRLSLPGALLQREFRRQRPGQRRRQQRLPGLQHRHRCLVLRRPTAVVRARRCRSPP